MSDALHFPIDAARLARTDPAAGACKTFIELAEYVRSLPYGRTTRPGDPWAVLAERRGTCSAKHQLLATVARDAGRAEVRLTVGVYSMSEGNTPDVGAVLAAAGVPSIPEAHCYLTVGGRRFDFTGLAGGKESPFAALIEEHVVAPTELPARKRAIHARALARWARAAGLSEAAAWSLREACIAALAAGR